MADGIERVDVAVIGAGISGLTTAYRIRQAAPNASLRVLEAGDRPGGTATTDHVDGFTLERGPNGVLTNVLHTVELAEELGLSSEVVHARDVAKSRYIFAGGKLLPVPKRLASRRLLGVRGLARLMREPWVAPDAPDGDESVRAFAARRFGPRAAEILGDVAIAGITGGDADRTSLRALFPKLHRAEVEFGSVTRGLKAMKPPHETRLISFANGMQSLLDALAARLDAALLLSWPAASCVRDGEGWRVTARDGRVLRASTVVVATAAGAASRLLASETAASSALAAIPYGNIRVVSLGFADGVSHPLDGFGFLVHPSESRELLGSVWSSSVFPGRAPRGAALLRVMLGGARCPEAVEQDEAWAEDVALSFVRRALGTSARPTLVHHAKWPASIPLYELGHAERMRTLDRALDRAPGLHLCGNAYDGVAFNECIRSAGEVAGRVAATLHTS